MKTENARPLYAIASEIRKDWNKINYAAKPYLDAMGSIGDIHDSYGYDSGKGIVRYFLSNASTWKGDTAKRIKAELKSML
jgi:hypothetical protein